jgi:hypothetical protein
VAVNSRGAYLRHRVAAEQAYRRRRRLLWWCRLAVALALCVFYFAIGRDLIAIASAKQENAKLEVAHEAKELRGDIKQLAGAQARLDDQVVSGDAPGALAEKP